MDLLVAIVVGGLAGWLAGLLMKARRQLNLLAAVVVGIVGSVLGQWLFSLLQIRAYGLIGRLVVAVVGAMVLIALLRGLKILR